MAVATLHRGAQGMTPFGFRPGDTSTNLGVAYFTDFFELGAFEKNASTDGTLVEGACGVFKIQDSAGTPADGWAATKLVIEPAKGRRWSFMTRLKFDGYKPTTSYDTLEAMTTNCDGSAGTPNCTPLLDCWCEATSTCEVRGLSFDNVSFGFSGQGRADLSADADNAGFTVKLGNIDCGGPGSANTEIDCSFKGTGGTDSSKIPIAVEDLPGGSQFDWREYHTFGLELCETSSGTLVDYYIDGLLMKSVRSTDTAAEMCVMFGGTADNTEGLLIDAASFGGPRV